MTREEFVARCETRREQYARVGAMVNGAQLMDEVLADFALLCQEEDDAELTLEEAAAELAGFSVEGEAAERSAPETLLIRNVVRGFRARAVRMRAHHRRTRQS